MARLKKTDDRDSQSSLLTIQLRRLLPSFPPTLPRSATSSILFTLPHTVGSGHNACTQRSQTAAGACVPSSYCSDASSAPIAAFELTALPAALWIASCVTQPS
eukprot:scaffold9696_cov112-Isochrysis_galbana.AAC.4